MTVMRNMPVPLSKEELVTTLREILKGVETGDTLEGSIEFLLPYPDPCQKCRGTGRIDGMHYMYGKDEPPITSSALCLDCGGNGMGPEPEGDFEVRASYRIGNSMGQGGIRMIGEMREFPDG